MVCILQVAVCFYLPAWFRSLKIQLKNFNSSPPLTFHSTNLLLLYVRSHLTAGSFVKITSLETNIDLSLGYLRYKLTFRQLQFFVYCSICYGAQFLRISQNLQLTCLSCAQDLHKQLVNDSNLQWLDLFKLTYFINNVEMSAFIRLQTLWYGFPSSKVYKNPLPTTMSSKYLIYITFHIIYYVGRYRLLYNNMAYVGG